MSAARGLGRAGCRPGEEAFKTFHDAKHVGARTKASRADFRCGMCVCCPPACWAACFVFSAMRSVGQPRSPEEIEMQKARRERKGFGTGERLGEQGAPAAQGRGNDAGAATVAPSTVEIEMLERRQGQGG